jgi:aromatic ring-opening dioxygenase catalytic subunit (LigB family)
MGILPLTGLAMKLNDLSKISEDFPATEKMPVLFLGHGSPMNAIEENEFVKGFREIGKTIPTPTAILCISAHWFTNGTKVTAMEMPQTIHDFGGFPQALFDVQERLIIGSGNIIHNLGMIDFANANRDNYGYDWAVEARATINKYILDENYKPLIDYKNQSKAFQLAIPTPDHYLPFIYTLGLKEKSETIQLFNDKLLAGSLSMTSLKIS